MLNPPSTPMLILAALGFHNGAKAILKLFSLLRFDEIFFTVSIVDVLKNYNKSCEIVVVILAALGSHNGAKASLKSSFFSPIWRDISTVSTGEVMKN